MANAALRAGAAALALAGTAALVQRRARQAEREHPPLGRFITVDGVRLHYVEQGAGRPLVLLHGLGSMVEELLSSGLVREASQSFRVIAFDRPGYGHSERPRRMGPAAQAALFRRALQEIEAPRPVLFGHSWGTLVALEFALGFPGAARALVLGSGLYFPTLRLDGAVFLPPGLPLLGRLLSHTVSPLAGRAMWRAWMERLYAPLPAPAEPPFPPWMALRPSQLRAAGDDTLFTLPALLGLARRCRELRLPITLLAGREDRYVSTRAHTLRLHRLMPETRLVLSPRAGHMVHHCDLPLVLEALAAHSG